MLQSNVNFNLYKSFLAVYVARNISKAAATLQITQPTVTYNVKELERQLNVKLFHTHPRGVEPTKDAHELYKFVSEGMQGIINGENAIREFNQTSKSTIRIAATCGFAGTFLAKPIAEFLKKYPLVHFDITNSCTDDSAAKLLQANTDLVIKITKEDFAGLWSLKLVDLNRTAITTKTFAETNKLETAITSKMLASSPIITFQKDAQPIEAQTGAVPLSVEDAQIMLALVKQDLGIGICYEEHLEGLNIDGIIKLGLEKVDLPQADVKLFFNQESLTKASKVFLEYLCSEYGVKNPITN